MIEYADYGILFDLCEQLGGMGENVGRFYLKQLIDTVMNYMHEKKRVVHLDLKLENVLLDSDLNVKVADLGFSTFKK